MHVSKRFRQIDRCHDVTYEAKLQFQGYGACRTWSEVEGQYCCNRGTNSGRGICLNISVTDAGDYGFESP